MKKTFVIPLLMIIGLAGCDTIDRQQLRPKLIGLSDSVLALSESVDSYQATTDTLAEKLRAAGAVDANDTASLEKIGREIDRIQPALESISKAVKSSAEMPPSDDTQALIAAIKAANAASAPVNPYSPIIDGVLAVVAVLAGVLAKKKSTEAAAATAKYTAHKIGVEKTLVASTDVDLKEKIYNNIGEARSRLGV